MSVRVFTYRVAATSRFSAGRRQDSNHCTSLPRSSRKPSLYVCYCFVFFHIMNHLRAERAVVCSGVSARNYPQSTSFNRTFVIVLCSHFTMDRDWRHVRQHWRSTACSPHMVSSVNASSECFIGITHANSGELSILSDGTLAVRPPVTKPYFLTTLSREEFLERCVSA